MRRLCSLRNLNRSRQRYTGVYTISRYILLCTQRTNASSQLAFIPVKRNEYNDTRMISLARKPGPAIEWGSKMKINFKYYNNITAERFFSQLPPTSSTVYDVVVNTVGIPRYNNLWCKTFGVRPISESHVTLAFSDANVRTKTSIPDRFQQLTSYCFPTYYVLIITIRTPVYYTYNGGFSASFRTRVGVYPTAHTNYRNQYMQYL